MFNSFKMSLYKFEIESKFLNWTVIFALSKLYSIIVIMGNYNLEIYVEIENALNSAVGYCLKNKMNKIDFKIVSN